MRNLGLLIICFLQFSCTSQVKEKINGVSFVASREKVGQHHVDEILNVHANHAAVMPYGFIREINSPHIIFDTERQWFGETKSGAKQCIEMLQKNGIKVMLKPQIWIWRGEFTGKMKMKSETDWKSLEISYEKFILAYAVLAQETNTTLFCIGTELEQFVVHRPMFWKELIKKIKEVYKGQLTYAANWDEYSRTTFWEDMDFIGIDAYFPLSKERTPSVEQLRLGWQKHKNKMNDLSEEKDRPIIFTEYGYRSMDYAAKKPWLVDRNDDNVNLVGQANAKKAIFEEFWSEDWFAGGYVWKWFIHHEQAGGGGDNRFTPQNKPAQEVIRDFYKMY